MAFSVQNLSGYTPGIHEKSFVLNLNQLGGMYPIKNTCIFCMDDEKDMFDMYDSLILLYLSLGPWF